MHDENSPESRRALRYLTVFFLGGIVALMSYSVFTGGAAGFPALFSVSVLVLGASALLGGALGFLFGIPRSLQNEARAPQAPGADDASRETDAASPRNSDTKYVGYIANTNLEQISDWLTKILVGVGLTQLGSLNSHFGALLDVTAPAFGEHAVARVYAGALMVFGVLLGFLFGYLWTRLFLIGALRYADRIGLLAAKAMAAEQKVDELQKKAVQDARALEMVERQLRSQPDRPPPALAELKDALTAASIPVRAQAFYRASDQRRRNWSEPGSKPAMELTIPVFQALIATDQNREYHQNHGQLGYALKDSSSPRYAEAEQALTAAIDIRRKMRETGWNYYELCRAICIVMQDARFTQTPPQASDEETKAKVMNDLQVALTDRYTANIARKDGTLLRWCKLNGFELNR